MSAEISVKDSRVYAAAFFKDIVSERCSRLPVEYPVLLEQGKTPYGHIFTDNLASLQLQKKMGFRVCPGKIYWIS